MIILKIFLVWTYMFSLKKVLPLGLMVCVCSVYSMETPALVVEALFDACGVGDVERVKHLSKDVSDINKVVRKASYRVMRFVDVGLRCGIPMVVIEKSEVTLLGFSCEKDQLEVVKYLVEEKKADIHRAGINSTSPFEDVPLVRARSNKVRQYLFEQGADPHVKYVNGEGINFFKFDVFEKPLAVAHELINKRAYDVNKRCANGGTQLMIMGDNVSVVECFINAGAEVNNETNGGLTALFHANQQGNYNVAKLLLAKGARLTVSDKNRKQNQMMSLVASLYYGYVDFFTCFLKEENIDINMQATNCTILHDIADEGSFNQLKKAGLEGKKIGDWSNKKITVFLLSQGADPLIKDKIGKLPFEHAKDDEIRNILRSRESARSAIIEYKFKDEHPVRLLRNRELTGRCTLSNYK